LTNLCFVVILKASNALSASKEEEMFIIHGYPVDYLGLKPVIMAAYRLTDDNVVIFDESRGVAEFIAELKDGVSLMDEHGQMVVIRPEDGLAFHEACQHAFVSMPIAWADEHELNRLRRQFPSPHHSLPPASVA